MILVDTSIWIDHLHRADPFLSALLEDESVSCHPMVIGELALGSLRRRAEVLTLLTALPQAVTATHQEVMSLVEGRALHGVGITLVDAHLLASTLLTPRTRLWTRDRRLRVVADGLGLADDPGRQR